MYTVWAKSGTMYLYANNFIKNINRFLNQTSFTVEIRIKCTVTLSLKISSHLHFLVKCQTSHSSWRWHYCVNNADQVWRVASKPPGLIFGRLCCLGCPSKDINVDDSRQTTSWSRRSSLSGAVTAFGWPRLDHWRRRLECVVQQQGGHIEHLM